jgi:hypothetical protein
MYVKGRWMHVEVGIDVWRAGDKVLSVSAPVSVEGSPGVLSNTCIPRPFPDKMHIKKEYNGPN